MIPQIKLISVVLPAPLGPSRAKISPRRISRLTLFRAWKPDAYVFVRFLTEMIGGTRPRDQSYVPDGQSHVRHPTARGDSGGTARSSPFHAIRLSPSSPPPFRYSPRSP